MVASSGQCRPGLHKPTPDFRGSAYVDDPRAYRPVRPAFRTRLLWSLLRGAHEGHRSNELVQTGLLALTNLEHRGATGAEPDSGDGAGILIQVPDRLLRGSVDFELPAEGSYAAGIVFLPATDDAGARAQAQIESIMGEEGLTVHGGATFRSTPIASAKRRVRRCRRSGSCSCRRPGERSASISTGAPTWPASAPSTNWSASSTRTSRRCRRAQSCTRACSRTPQLSEFFLDLTDDRIESALLLVHSRFSTNTFPSWPLAHPYRYVAHNGEINTVQGNQNWMRAREAMAASDDLPGLEQAFPICTPGASDTARFDEVLELLHLGGRPLHHAVLMMIPEAWENNDEMDADRRAFYQFHASVMEPWDGPPPASRSPTVM